TATVTDNGSDCSGGVVCPSTTSVAALVNAGTAGQLVLAMPGETLVEGQPGGKTGAPSALTAGGSQTLTVRAVDGFANQATSGHQISIQSSDGFATVPAQSPLASG